MTSTTSRLPVDDHLVGIRRWGDGAPDVVLVHGAGGNRDSLAPLGDALADRGLDVVAVSLPGRDGSDGPPVSSLAEAAAVVAEVVAVLAPDGCVMLGHSMGGGVVLEATLATGVPVRGLALVATGARLRVHPAILRRAEETVEGGGHLAEISAAALLADTPDPVRAQVVAVHERTPGPTALADWQATDAFDRLDDIGELQVPVLAVAGEVDHLTPPRYAEFVADHAPSAELVVLPGAGHWLPVEEADQVADAVAAFVRRLPPA